MCAAEDVQELMPFLMREFAHEFVPPKEDPAAHRRQMTPGDYRRKLQPVTIDALTKRFGFYFDALDGMRNTSSSMESRRSHPNVQLLRRDTRGG